MEGGGGWFTQAFGWGSELCVSEHTLISGRVPEHMQGFPGENPQRVDLVDLLCTFCTFPLRNNFIEIMPSKPNELISWEAYLQGLVFEWQSYMFLLNFIASTLLLNLQFHAG